MSDVEIECCGEQPPVSFGSWCQMCGSSEVEVTGCHNYCTNCHQVSSGCGD